MATKVVTQQPTTLSARVTYLMSIPAELTRDHVLAAIERLKKTGIPANAQSTRYDLVDVDGNRWPPKAVIEAAAEIATGKPLPRTEFSGGDQSNDRLLALGFDVQPKPGATFSSLELVDLKPGMVINNDDLVHAFKVGNAGGMRYSSAHGCLVLIADHTKSLYDDRWDGDILHYTGMGTIGDQSLTGQNQRLANQQQSGTAVHLFEVFQKNRYAYSGQVALVGPLNTEQQPDEEGNLRTVFVFPLKLQNLQQPLTPTIEEIQHIRQDRQRKVRKKSVEDLRRLAEAAGNATPGRRTVTTVQCDRNEYVVAYVKKQASGICDLCKKLAPFASGDGPYLECHHVKRLADSGPDTIDNAVALCANCHRKMHVLNLEHDRHLLQERIRLRDA